MSRTRRDYGPYVNPEEWICPWQAIGDHNPCFLAPIRKNISNS